MSPKCLSCGAENPESQKFCGSCGHSLEEPPKARLGLVKCPNCGFDNKDGRRYCAGCGSMIPRTPRLDPQADEGERREA